MDVVTAGRGSPPDEARRTSRRPAVGVELQVEIEQFLYFEAELLDEHRYAEWYGLFADDVRYRGPTQANQQRRDRDGAVGGGADRSAGVEVALFDDDKLTLG